ncbi:unnamed protein product [Phytophthora lilii]|uniref:RxLR effector protein n=1 Tax=Phytophthora lilii TaxID=2077276 RepID=A0A9W6TNB3_9STRA|nr:unnamed protein product [Phytophthora lilii]
MRLSFVLLAATLLASGSAISTAADSEQAALTTMASPDQVDAVNAGHDNKRFLRRHKTEDPDDDDNLDDVDDDDDEERLRLKKLKTCLRGTPETNLRNGSTKSIHRRQSTTS